MAMNKLDTFLGIICIMVLLSSCKAIPPEINIPDPYDKAKDIASQGIPFFWDRWSLPRRLAERREAVGDHPLDATIEASIRKAAVVWGIESNLYGHPGSYAAHERELAQRLNKYQTDLF